MLAMRLSSLVEVEVVLEDQKEVGQEHGALCGHLLICLGRMSQRMDDFLFVLHHVNQAMGQQYNDWAVVIPEYCYQSSWLSFHLVFSRLFVML